MPGMTFNNWKTISFPRSLVARWPPGPLAAVDRVLSWNRSGCLEAGLTVSGQLPGKSKQNLPLELVAGLLPRPLRPGELCGCPGDPGFAGTLRLACVCSVSGAGPTSRNVGCHWLFLLG